MKRNEIKKLIESGVTEFAMARHGRTKGIDAHCICVEIKSAEPAARKLFSNYSNHLERKPTGVSVTYLGDQPFGTKAGHVTAVQPQDIVATWADYETRQVEVREFNERKRNADDAEKQAAQDTLEAFINTTGVDASILFERFRAPGNRYSIRISLDAAAQIASVTA